jgi:hypothetical protein
LPIFIIIIYKAKEKAREQLETSVALFSRARNQTNITRYGSSDGVKSRELLLLSAEAALTNDHYDMARKQVFRIAIILKQKENLNNFSWYLHECTDLILIISTLPPFSMLFYLLMFRHMSCCCSIHHPINFSQGLYLYVLRVMHT